MGEFFSLDSKFMQVANKVADLMWLNILTLVCCLPIFTIGAAVTAMHNVLLKIYRNEEGYITKQYFKSFKENFKQSTLIFLIYIFLLIVFILDFRIIINGVIAVPKFLLYVLLALAIIAAISYVWVFVLQSRYENKIRTTIKNSLVVGISKPWYSTMMLLFLLIPLLAIYYFEAATPIALLLGFTVPGILQTMLYSKVFDRLEGVDRKALKSQQGEEDGWSVELEEEAAEAQTTPAIETASEDTQEAAAKTESLAEEPNEAEA